MSFYRFHVCPLFYVVWRDCDLSITCTTCSQTRTSLHSSHKQFLWTELRVPCSHAFLYKKKSPTINQLFDKYFQILIQILIKTYIHKIVCYSFYVMKAVERERENLHAGMWFFLGKVTRQTQVGYSNMAMFIK